MFLPTIVGMLITAKFMAFWQKILTSLDVITGSALVSTLTDNARRICEDMQNNYSEIKSTYPDLTEQEVIEMSLRKQKYFKQIGENAYKYGIGVYRFNPEKNLDLQSVVKQMVLVMMNARTQEVSGNTYDLVQKNCFEVVNKFFD